eukprot:963122-Lingulodinium_polyedra.AAC.1
MRVFERPPPRRPAPRQCWRPATPALVERFLVQRVANSSSGGSLRASHALPRRQRGVSTEGC